MDGAVDEVEEAGRWARGERSGQDRPVPKVIVVGSLNLDRPWRVDDHPRVGETILGERLAAVAGGKGLNQAVAARRMGARTVLIGRVGDDSAGERLREVAAAEGVVVAGVGVDPDTPTGAALIVLDRAGANTVTVDPGANANLRIDQLPVERGDLVVAQTEIPADVVRAAFALARRAGAITLLNPSPIDVGRALVASADVVVVNEHEAADLVGAGRVGAGRGDSKLDAEGAGDTAGDDEAEGRSVAGSDGEAVVEAAIGWAREIAGSARSVVVTLGAAGLIACHEGRVVKVPGRPVDVVDTVGAGDCLLGSLAARLAAGDDWDRALDLANRAAALAVGRPGAVDAMPHLAGVLAAQRRPS